MAFPHFLARLCMGALLVGCSVAALGVLSTNVVNDRPAQRPMPAAPHAKPAGRETVPGAPRRGSRASGAQKPAARSGGAPTLVIRALGIRAPVVPVQATQRVLTPPDDVTTVGWWRDGARPGATRGSAVLVGHTVSTGGGVFDHLARLRPGDRVSVVTAHRTLRYAVADVGNYSKRFLATHAQIIFDQRVVGRLVLVTCGNWNGQVYKSNEVVTARALRPRS